MGGGGLWIWLWKREGKRDGKRGAGPGAGKHSRPARGSERLSLASPAWNAFPPPAPRLFYLTLDAAGVKKLQGFSWLAGPCSFSYSVESDYPVFKDSVTRRLLRRCCQCQWLRYRLYWCRRCQRLRYRLCWCRRCQ